MAGTLADAQRDAAQELSTLPSTEIRAGTLKLISGQWLVTVGTNPIKAIWGEHVTPRHEAPCVVAMISMPGGQSTAWVLAVTQEAPLGSHEGKVLVVPAGSPTITVEANGASRTATIVGPYSPAINDTVLLEQRGGTLYAVGKVGATTAPAPVIVADAPTAPPPQIISGTSDFRASDSGTHTPAVGGWNGYYGQMVYSGSGYVPPSTGHWFYGGATRGLADKTTITKVRFFLGARRQAGAYNNAATVHFYRHNNDNRAGEPGRTHGPHDISIPPYWGGGWVELPASFGEALKGGGGISIAGDPYVGFASGSMQPDSGTLSIDWSK